MALKQIKGKIKSTERTSKVTKAMEAVSAVKMRKSQERALSGRPYAEAALRILENISHSFELKNHPYFRNDHGTHDCVITITSDKGLAGSLNSAVLKETYRYLGSMDRENVDLICFGKKSYEHFARRGYSIPKHYLNMSDEVTIDDMEEVVTYVTEKFRSGRYKNVIVIYQNFISTFEQHPTSHCILPIQTEQVRAMIEDIKPTKGKYSETEYMNSNISYTFEQREILVFDALLRTLVEIMLYHALLESKASEHSARMVAMKNATDKAREVGKTFTILYNKARQGVITREVSEITGGIEAMKNA